jgi:hypothetical protein
MACNHAAIQDKYAGPDASHPNIGLTRDDVSSYRNMRMVSRWFRVETDKAVWQTSVKRFNEIPTMTNVFSLIFRVLISIHLSFTNADYFQLLGYHFDNNAETLRRSISPVAFRLKHIALTKNRRHLRLQIKYDSLFATRNP